MKFLVFISLLSSASVAFGSPANENAPWQVSIFTMKHHYCGGAIISTSGEDNWILTAAQCVAGFSPDQIQIRYNTVKSNRGGHIVAVEKVIVHEKYRKNQNDIALLKTANKLMLGSAKAIPLAPPDGNEPSGEVTISGWGSLCRCTREVCRSLRVATVALVTRAQCQQMFSASDVHITENMICASGREACNSDSGGPAVQHGQLVGVASFERGCFQPGPARVLYTRVSKYIEWIKSNGVLL